MSEKAKRLERSTGAFLSEINNAGEKAGKQTRRTASHVERRSPLSMIVGVEFASNSWIVGGRADLYIGGVHEAEAPVFT